MASKSEKKVEPAKTEYEESETFDLHNCRILSFEGNAGLELTSTLLLKEIAKRRPDFMLHNNLVLAGTSAGGMQALILAGKDNPVDNLEKVADFWPQFPKLVQNTVIGSGLAMVGVRSFLNDRGLRNYLGQEQLLGRKTLGNLKKKVIVTSFRLHGIRHWRPKIFHNFHQPGCPEPDLKEKAVDVALRTGAAPIMMPVVDGYIDGSTVAYGPAVVAIAQIRHEMRAGDNTNESLKDVKLLSIGVGQYPFHPNVQSARWGYLKWLFDPLRPLLVAQALYEGDSIGTTYAAKHILSKNNYYRLNPTFTNPHFLSGPLWNSHGNIRKTVESDVVQESIDKTVAWMDDTGW